MSNARARRWTVAAIAGIVILAGMAQPRVASTVSAASTEAVLINGREVWDGEQNPHGAEGVTLRGSGTRDDPCVYGIPAALCIAGSGELVLSGNEDVDYSITLAFADGGLHMDPEARIDVAREGRRTGEQRLVLDLGGHNLTGAGVIGGRGHERELPRSVVIRNAGDVALRRVDLSRFDVAGTADLAITASSHVRLDSMTDGGTDAEHWDSRLHLGQWDAGPVTAVLTHLRPESQYAARFRATNAAGSTWSPVAATFTTERSAASEYFPSFADRHTMALWLFDETPYPGTTLTDAGPHEHDLRFMPGGRLGDGRFGGALYTRPGAGMAVSYAGWKGDVAHNHLREPDGQQSGLWGPTIAPARLLRALAGSAWTVELWLRLGALPESGTALLDLGDAFEPGFQLRWSAGGLTVDNAYAATEAACPLTMYTLQDSDWHHLAVVQADGRITLYVDGRRQSRVALTDRERVPVPPAVIPEERDHTTFGFTVDSPVRWRQEHRFNVALGQDRQGTQTMDAAVDEVRISDMKRYADGFEPPHSFSRWQAGIASPPARPSGEPLLFGPEATPGVVPLGDRKHVFIDAALLAQMNGVRLTVNTPVDPQVLDFTVRNASWRATVVDHAGKIYMYIPDGYGSGEGMTRVRWSADGIHFQVPELDAVEYEGSTGNEFVLAGAPLYGTFFKDANPEVRPEERFKLTAWVANRGIYVYLSPDGIHWRRNETCMLPLVSGGGAETFWDDQQGLYTTLLKRDSSFNTPQFPGHGRRAVLFKTAEMLRTWPFRALEEPYFEGRPMPSVTGEGGEAFSPDANGEVYRTRAIKYPWAPDTYVAFVWRFAGDESRQVDLAVSRDGEHWQSYADQAWYMPAQGEIDGKPVAEVLSLYGLIRRGGQLWQYADYGTGVHGGGERTYARLTQRLDGFVALRPEGDRGTALTRPLRFDGERLVLNADAAGQIRVALLNEAGEPLPGFALEDCDPVQEDGTALQVSWHGRRNVRALAGRVVQVLFELEDAELFAFQFVRADDPTGVRTPDPAVPEFAARPAYPNPANPGAQFEYSLPRQTRVRIDLCDVLGQKVKTLTPGLRAAGAHRATWDGSDVRGRRVGSGLYTYIASSPAAMQPGAR